MTEMGSFKQHYSETISIELKTLVTENVLTYTLCNKKGVQ